MKSDKLIFIIVAIIAFSFPWELFAQVQKNFPYKKNTPAYIHYLSKKYGITIKIPQNFIDLHKYYIGGEIRKKSKMRVGYLYGPFFQTKNKACIVMYPALPIYVSEKDKEKGKKTVKINRALNGDTSTVMPMFSTYKFTRGQITSEIKDNTGLYAYSGKPVSDSVHFHFNDHVTIIAGKKAKALFNADTLYIYDLPLQKPYHKKYTYRTGLVLFKKDRASMFFMLFFTPKGKKEEQKYIHRLSKNVWYDEDFKQNEKAEHIF
jgi:hypothetical protein